jgi:hypothetical protein
MVGGLENPPRMRTWMMVVRYEKHYVFSSYYDIFRVSKHVPYARQCWLGPTNHVHVFLSYGSVDGRLCWLDSLLSSHKNNTNPNKYYYLLSKYLYLCVRMGFLCWMFQLL